MHSILITGATDLLGQDLVQLAREARYDIRIMSRRSRPAKLRLRSAVARRRRRNMRKAKLHGKNG